ncbi:hypothetical protein LXA43DRAFT_977203 [Ganoderma leucocontextum]|nr:hypothetical protein LXA43DRAFT_977203 [Ganoderma leucocontextum]
MPPSYTFTWRVLCYYLCAAAIVMCALWFNLRVCYAFRASTTSLSVREWHEHDFSYLEDDYPPTLIPPSQHPRNVALITEETVHYFPNASQDWESMLPTESEGFVRLGPQKRLFGVSMYHQLHCLGRLQRATTHSWERCCALRAVRLEALEDDPAGSGGKKTDGMGLEHRCKDWTLVRREVETNFEHWSWEDPLP